MSSPSLMLECNIPVVFQSVTAPTDLQIKIGVDFFGSILKPMMSRPNIKPSKLGSSKISRPRPFQVLTSLSTGVLFLMRGEETALVHPAIGYESKTE